MTQLAAEKRTIPFGYCHCGCGQRTKLALQTQTRSGWIKGQPQRYLYRHYRGDYRPKPWKHQPNVAAFSGYPVEPEAAYWAGFILADGSVRNPRRGGRGRGAGAVLDVQLHDRDTCHLERMASYVCPTAEVHPCAGRSAVRLIVPGMALVKALRRFGIVPRKSYGHPIPSLHDSEVAPFLRGFFDGDGCVGVYEQDGLRYPHWILVGRRDWLCVVRDLLEPVAQSQGSLCMQKSGYTGKPSVSRLSYVGRAVPHILRFINGSPRLARKGAVVDSIIQGIF